MRQQHQVLLHRWPPPLCARHLWRQFQLHPNLSFHRWHRQPQQPWRWPQFKVRGRDPLKNLGAIIVPASLASTSIASPSVTILNPPTTTSVQSIPYLTAVRGVNATQAAQAVSVSVTTPATTPQVQPALVTNFVLKPPVSPVVTQAVQNVQQTVQQTVQQSVQQAVQQTMQQSMLQQQQQQAAATIQQVQGQQPMQTIQPIQAIHTPPQPLGLNQQNMPRTPTHVQYILPSFTIQPGNDKVPSYLQMAIPGAQVQTGNIQLIPSQQLLQPAPGQVAPQKVQIASPLKLANGGLNCTGSTDAAAVETGLAGRPCADTHRTGTADSWPCCPAGEGIQWGHSLSRSARFQCRSLLLWQRRRSRLPWQHQGKLLPWWRQQLLWRCQAYSMFHWQQCSSSSSSCW